MRKRELFLLLLIFLFSIVLLTSNTTYAADENTYDVILFWGQSNMVGFAGNVSHEKLENTNTYYDDDKTKKTDPRIANEELLNYLLEAKGYTVEDFTRASAYGKLTGINYNKIVRNTKSMDYVEITQVQDPNDSNRGTAFEYSLIDGKVKNLIELGSTSYKLGENIAYTPTSIYESYKKTNSSKRYNEMLNGTLGNQKVNGYYSIQESKGTNMIPEFCKEYYEKTGRKVVVVMCAYGGQSISNFLPVTDKDYGYEEDKTPLYIYETMVMKYNEAIDYLEGRGYTIGNRYYVVSQARWAKSEEADAESEEELANKQANYERIFMKVHEYLKQDLGITKGAIVLSGSAPGADDGFKNYTGQYSYAKVRPVQQAQLNLIKNNQDIILASAFHYKNYLPDETTYNSVKDGNSTKYVSDKFKKLDGTYLNYGDALKLAKLSLCTTNDNMLTSNSMHFTAAALSQTGLETAQSFASSADSIEIVTNPTKVKYIVGDSLNTSGLKIKVTNLDGTTEEITKGFTCSPTKLNKVGTQTITVSYEGETITFTVTVQENTLSKIEVISKPSKLTYYVGDTLDISGLKIKAIYANGTTKEVTSFTYDPTKLNKAGTQTITVTYGGKITTFNVTVLEKPEEKLEINIEEYIVEKAGETKYISNINPGVKAGQVLEKIQVNNGATKQVYKGTTEVSVDKELATGMKIVVSLNGQTEEYIVIVSGDTNGDGMITATDLTRMKNHILGRSILTDLGLKAADINNDGRITASELTKIKKYVLGFNVELH